MNFCLQMSFCCTNAQKTKRWCLYRFELSAINVRQDKRQYFEQFSTFENYRITHSNFFAYYITYFCIKKMFSIKTLTTTVRHPGMSHFAFILILSFPWYCYLHMVFSQVNLCLDTGCAPGVWPSWKPCPELTHTTVILHWMSWAIRMIIDEIKELRLSPWPTLSRRWIRFWRRLCIQVVFFMWATLMAQCD